MSELHDVVDEDLCTFDKSPYESCVICMDVIRETNKSILSCGHQFHTSCLLENALQSNNSCPLCRVVVCKKASIIPELNGPMIHLFIERAIYKEKRKNIKPCIKNIVKLCNADWKKMSHVCKQEILTNVVDTFISFGMEMGKSISQWMKEENRENDIIEEEAESEATESEAEAEAVAVAEPMIETQDNTLFEEFIQTYNLTNYRSRIMNNEYLRNFNQFICADVETLMWPHRHLDTPHNVSEHPLFSREEADHIIGMILLYLTQFVIENDT